MAEVLITLGIIGVVAALTLPNLIADYREKVLVSQAKKMYSVMMNAMNLYLNDRGASGDYTALMVPNKSNNEIMAEFSKYFNGAKVCETNASCRSLISYKIKQLKPKNDGHGKNEVEYVHIGATIILNDGSIISLKNEGTNAACEYLWTQCVRDPDGNFVMNGDECQTITTPAYRCGQIRVDTNGKKGPNRIGSDVFTFLVKQNKIEFMESAGDLNYILKYNKTQPYEDYEAGGDFKK